MATDSLRTTPPTVPEQLFDGNRLDQPTFHRLYEQTPEDFKAELIGGIVHVASPVGISHSDRHGLIIAWLRHYFGEVPGTHAMVGATVILGEESEPQPDACLRYEDGPSRVSGDRCIGPPELVVEVSHSTVVHDLLEKRSDYHRNGVREYLVLVIPDSRAVWFAHNDHAGFAELSKTEGILRSRAFPGLWLDGNALFQLDYKRLMAVLRDGLASVGTGD